MRELLAGSETGLRGLDEMETVVKAYEALPHSACLEVDLSLARGLNYYTGTIIEVKALDVEIGSITGGGRYDNLTGVFGMEGLSGVGISFGADRIYDVLNTLGLYPQEVERGVQVMFTNFGEEEAREALGCVWRLRDAGIPAMVYPDNAKMKKQMQYANAKNVPYVAIIGSEELKEGVATVKNMADGSQRKVELEKITEIFK